MTRSYRYLLKPSRAQQAVLATWLVLTRELYNAALEERRGAWRCGVSRSCFDQCADVPAIRAARPEFVNVPVIVLRGALRRLDKAFKAFFRRVKAGDAPGYPRFKGAKRWHGIQIDDIGRGCGQIGSDGKRITIPMLGHVCFKQHRPVQGTPKAMRLTQDARGRWYVTLCCIDVPADPLPICGKTVGVDLGLTHFAATSDGELFDNPRPLVAARIEMERASRRVSRKKRGSKRQRKARRILAIKQEHVANIRREHHIGVARSLVKGYGKICVEALNVKGLARGMLSKSTHDAGWGNFLHWLHVKAESAGREVVEVNPAGTSQTCPQCGTIKKKTLAERVHRCSVCGLVLNRDVAAARVILRLGMSQQGEAPSTRGPRRSAKSTAARGRSGHAFLPSASSA